MQHLDAIHRQMGDTRTPRALQNFAYMAHAIAVLEPLLPRHPELRWLYDPDAIMRREAHFQQTIMQELGRVQDEGYLVALAIRICELRPKSHEAVKMLRRARVQHGARGSIEGLTDVLRRALNDYLRWRPDLTLADAQEAVGELWLRIDEQLNTDQPES
jgi:hypothetical protein